MGTQLWTQWEHNCVHKSIVFITPTAVFHCTQLQSIPQWSAIGLMNTMHCVAPNEPGVQCIPMNTEYSWNAFQYIQRIHSLYSWNAFQYIHEYRVFMERIRIHSVVFRGIHQCYGGMESVMHYYTLCQKVMHFKWCIPLHIVWCITTHCVRKWCISSDAFHYTLCDALLHIVSESVMHSSPPCKL